MEDGERGVMTLVGGNFNARTEREEGRRRNSEDGKVNWEAER